MKATSAQDVLVCAAALIAVVVDAVAFVIWEIAIAVLHAYRTKIFLPKN